MRIYIILIFLVLFCASYGYVYRTGYSAGKIACEHKTFEKIVSIQEKRNEIRNNRPDTNVFFDRLWNDNSW